MSTCHFCRLDSVLHSADRASDKTVVIFILKIIEKIGDFCQISVLNHTTDQAISVDKTSGQ